MIKAIETEYNGYRFRSRLEARWAVFFDALGIKYEYEPEGFELSCGRYLPDFYLSEFAVYVEIKPLDRSHIDEWRAKPDTFRRETGKAILLCYGDPSEDVWKKLYAYDTCDNGGGDYESDAVFAVYGCKAYIIANDYRKDRVICIDSDWNSNNFVVTSGHFFYIQKGRLIEQRVEKLLEQFADSMMYNLFDPDAKDLLNLAKKAARQARFEHGESPRLP